MEAREPELAPEDEGLDVLDEKNEIWWQEMSSKSLGSYVKSKSNLSRRDAAPYTDSFSRSHQLDSVVRYNF